jgi:hypothetical protein
MAGMKNAFQIIVGKPGGEMRPLGRPGRKWEVNVKVNLKAIECVWVWAEFNWFMMGSIGGVL